MAEKFYADMGRHLATLEGKAFLPADIPLASGAFNASAGTLFDPQAGVTVAPSLSIGPGGR